MALDNGSAALRRLAFKFGERRCEAACQGRRRTLFVIISQSTARRRVPPAIIVSCCRTLIRGLRYQFDPGSRQPCSKAEVRSCGPSSKQHRQRRLSHPATPEARTRQRPAEARRKFRIARPRPTHRGELPMCWHGACQGGTSRDSSGEHVSGHPWARKYACWLFCSRLKGPQFGSTDAATHVMNTALSRDNESYPARSSK